MRYIRSIPTVFLTILCIAMKIVSSDELNIKKFHDKYLRNNINNLNYTTYKLQVPNSHSITIIEAVNTKNPQINSEETEGNELSSSTEGLNITKEAKPTQNLLEKFLSEYNFKINSQLPIDKFIRNISETKISHRDNRYNGQYFDQIETNNDDSYVNNNFDNYYQKPEIFSQHNYLKPPKPIQTFNKDESTSSIENDKYYDNKDDKKWISLQPVHWSKSQVLKWKPKQTSHLTNTGSNYNNQYGYGEGSSIKRKWTNYPQSSENYSSYDRDVLSFNNNLMEPYDRYHDKKYEDKNHYNDKTYRFYSSNYQKPSWSQTNGNRFKQPEIEVSSNYNRYYDYGYKPDLHESFNYDRYTPNIYNRSNPFSSIIYNKHKYDDDYETSSSSLHYSVTSPYNIKLVKPNNYYSNNYLHNDPHNRNYFKDSIKNTSLMQDNDGEWVILTSNKAYEKPSSTSTRPAHNMHKSRNNSSLSQTILNVIESRPATTNFRTHKSVKLTVLPSDNNKPIGLSHNGILEVDKSPETVEMAAADSNKKKLVKRKMRQMKLISLPIRSAPNNDQTAVLAAIGAGMVPATMAMLMPMVLGRKKRSLIQENQRNHTLRIHNYI